VTVNAQTQSQVLESLLTADAAGGLLSTVSAAFLDEQSIWAFNTAAPRVRLQAIYPVDGASVADLTYTRVVGSRTDPREAAVAADFGAFLAGSQGQKAFESMGYRSVGAASSPSLRADLGLRPARPVAVALPSAEVRSGLTAAWQRMQNPGRFLVVIDVSGSMKQEVAGTGRTKLEFAQDAAIAGMQLVPPAAEIGLWEFSTALQGGEDYRELVPTGPVGDTIGGQNRLSMLVSGARGLTPRGDTGLYDAALAAFRAMSRSYSPGEPNVVVLLTDGRNDDTNSPGLDSVLATLAAEQDPTRPVRFLTIAYGADADQRALAAIAAATKGSAYNSPNPADIGRVFFRALSQA
jgi:Ca-activated chloride channel family protein